MHKCHTQHSSSDNIPPLPPENHYSLDAVYRRGEGLTMSNDNSDDARTLSSTTTMHFSSRVVSAQTAVWEDPDSNHTLDGCVYRDSRWNLGNRLRTFTAVPRSTQPSTLRGTVKRVSAYVLSNNNNGDGGCGCYSCFRRTHSPSWLAWCEGWQPPGAQSTFIKWTRQTLAMTLVMMTAP